MRGLVLRSAICALLFMSVPETEAQGSAAAVRVRLSTNVGKVKNFFKPAADKLLPLRKGVAGALVGAFIYAGGMFPTATVAHDPMHLPRTDEMVIISQNDDERLLMPVRGWLPLVGTPLIVSPILVRNLAQTLITFVGEDDGNELMVSRMLRYWDEHLGERGTNLRAAVEAALFVRDKGLLVTRNDRTREYEGYPIEILKQRLALLTLAELTAGLNAALVGKNGRSDISKYTGVSLINDHYSESGYVTVETDDWGRAKTVFSHLYNYSYKGELLVTKTGESRLHIGRRDYDRIMNMAIVNNHYGVVSALLSVDETHGYDYDPQKHLETAMEFGRIQMVEALLVEVQACRNRALCVAAGNGDLSRVVALLASGADAINSALMRALQLHSGAVVDFLVAFEGVDFNEALVEAAASHDLKNVERFIELGADNFDEALEYFAEYAPAGGRVAGLLIERATDLNAALSSALRSENMGESGIWGYAGDLVRMLIRAGADDVEGALEALHDMGIEHEEEELLEIFAAKRPQQNPAQLPMQQ